MKKAKKVTKRQRKAQTKFLKELAAKAQEQLEVFDSKPKAQKKSVFLPLSVYLTKQAEKKHAKMHAREDRRNAKADKVAVRKAAKEAKRAAKEAKEAKRAQRVAKLQEAAQQ